MWKTRSGETVLEANHMERSCRAANEGPEADCLEHSGSAGEECGGRHVGNSGGEGEAPQSMEWKVANVGVAWYWPYWMWWCRLCWM